MDGDLRAILSGFWESHAIIIQYVCRLLPLDGWSCRVPDYQVIIYVRHRSLLSLDGQEVATSHG
jgi:hypothetical protein